MTEEKKIDPARNASPARSAAAASGEHSDAGGGELKEEIEEKKEPRKVVKSFFKKATKPEIKEEESAEALAEKYLLGWRRCLADFENYKKRQQENQKSIGEYLKEDWALQILPVIDNFRSATGHIPEDQANVPWVVGVMYIQKQLEDILKENGIVEMDVKVGDEFDPNLHEAIADNNQKKENEDGLEEEKEHSNKIIRVVLQGYRIGPAHNASHSDAGGGKVIRAARVVVE